MNERRRSCLQKINVKMRIPILAVLTACLLHSVLPAQTPAQTLQVTPPASSGDAHTFTVSELTPLRSLSFPQDPFYNVFWLFGDGEYAPAGYNFNVPNTKVSALNAQSLNNSWSITIHHTYQRAGKYEPFVLAMDRKGDQPPPPPSLRIKLPDTDNPVTAEGTQNPIPPRITNVPAGKKIDIAHSTGYIRDGRSSIFIISYKYEDTCVNANSAVTAHLFYGRKRQPNGTYVRSAHFPRAPEAHHPYYVQGDTRRPVVSHETTDPFEPFSYHDAFALTDGYITRVNGVLGANKEQRLFQEVFAAETNSTNYLSGSEWSFALTVLTSDNKTCGQNLTLSNLLEGVKGYNATKKTLNGAYIIDIDTIHLKGGEPDDPNRLHITRVCSDGSVHFSLEFCNKLTADNAAEGASVRFNILESRDFEWCGTQEEIRYGQSRKTLMRLPSSLQTGNPCNWFTGDAIFDCKNLSYSIPGRLARGECGTIEVVLKAKNGLRGRALLDYLTQKTVLRAEVQLCPSKVSLDVSNKLIPTQTQAKGQPIPAMEVTDCKSQCESCKEPEIPDRIAVVNVCSDGKVQLRLQFCNPSATDEITGSLVKFNILDKNFKWCGTGQIDYPVGEKRKVVNTTGIQDCATMDGQNSKVRYDCSRQLFSIPGKLAPGQCATVDVMLVSTKLSGTELLDYLRNNPILSAQVVHCPTGNALRIANTLPAQDIKPTSECPTPCKSCKRKQ